MQPTQALESSNSCHRGGVQEGYRWSNTEAVAVVSQVRSGNTRVVLVLVPVSVSVSVPCPRPVLVCEGRCVCLRLQ